MQVGVDAFTLSFLELEPSAMLDYAAAHDLAGVQFGGIPGWPDEGQVKELKAHADALGLYVEVGVACCNPHVSSESQETQIETAAGMIECAARHGWRELHSYLGGPDERERQDLPWAAQLADATAFIRRLGPVLRDCGCRINLETHGDATTFEYVRLIEEVGPDIAGICLDTANVLLSGEDPVEAARRAAPYTHLTHAKDGILFFSEHGLTRQGRPPGQGILDWEQIIAILAEHAPDLPLSIEDHKWMFDARLFDSDWYGGFPDLRAQELGSLVGHAWHCQQRIQSGEWPEPETYEAIPFVDQLEERLHAGRDHLRRIVADLGMA